MKIVFTGGGTGGHFYPVIAVAERVNEVIDREKIIGAKLYYFSSSPYDKELLFENNLIYEEVNAGKLRIYFSFKNFFSFFKSAFGILRATLKLFSIYPDVVFCKGGYASFPTVFAAKLLRIPVVVHESDAAPGRVNAWAAKFAKRIAVSFEDAAANFPPEKTAWLGHPIRKEIEQLPPRAEAIEYFKLESDLPTILVLGGSQGAELINDTLLDGLPRLLNEFQVIHQTGLKNFASVKSRAEIVLGDNANKARYNPMGYLSAFQLKMAASAADLVISRAGSNLFEIACWDLPAILIPITKSNADHQKKNAFAYARAGGCLVLEEENMTANILYSEIERVMTDKALYAHMKAGAKAFHKPDAALKIAEEIVKIALSHEE